MALPKIGMEAILNDQVFNRGVSAYKSAMTGMQGHTEKTAGGMSKLFGGMASVMSGVLGAQALRGLVNGIRDMAMEAVAVPSIAAAFEGLGGSLEKLRAGSMGMVTDVDLMKSYNQAAQLVSKDFAETLPDAMGYLSKVAAATGQDMGFMMDSLVKGVGRVSPMILDNLGVQVNLTEATEEWAKANGVAVEEMSKADQQAAVMAKTMELLARNTADMPDVAGSAAQQMAALQTTMKNLSSTLGVVFLPPLVKIVGKLSELAAEYGPKVIDTIGSMINYVRELSPAVVIAAGAIVGVAVAVGVVSTAFGAFTAAMATNPLGLAIIGITAAAVGLVALADAITKATSEEAVLARQTEAVDTKLKTMAADLGPFNGTFEQYIQHEVEAYQAAGWFAEGLTTEQMALELVKNELILTEGEFAKYVQRTDELVAKGALLQQWGDVQSMAMQDVARSAQAAVIETTAILTQWNNVPAMAAASANAVRQQLAQAAGVMAAAFTTEPMIKQFASTELAFAQHGQKMRDLAVKNAETVRDAQFQHNLQMAQEQQRYQQEHTALLAAGRQDEAAELSARFTNEQGMSTAQYAIQQALQERNYLIQQIQQKRAYIQELVTMRDQTLRVLQEQVKADAIKRGLEQAAINQMMIDIARSGSATLQLETQTYIARAQATSDYWKGTITATGAAVEAIKDIVSQEMTAETAAAAMDAQLSALENQLLANLPALPPIDTGAWDTSLDDAGGAVQEVGESATRTLADVTGDIQNAVASAMDAIKGLVGFDVPAGVDVGLGRLSDFVVLAVESMYAAFAQVKPQLAQIKDVFEPLGGVLDIVKKGVDTLTALAEYSAARDVVSKVQVLANDMAKVATELRNVFVEWKGTTDLKQEALDWWDKVTAMIANVKGGTDAMKALTEYAPVKNLVGKASTLSSDMIKTATAFRDVFVGWQGTTNLQQESLDWWEKVTTLTSNVQGGVNAMKALAEYKPVKNLVNKAQRLAGDIIKAATAFRDVFVGWRGTTNLTEAALDWWNSVSTLVGYIKGGVDALAALREYRPTANLASTVDSLAADMLTAANAMVARLKTIRQRWGIGVLQSAKETADAVKGVLELFGTNLMPTEIKLDFTKRLFGFLDALDLAFPLIMARLQAMRSKWGGKALAAAAAVSENVQGIVGVLSLGDVLAKLPVIGKGFQDRLTGFIDTLRSATGQLVTALLGIGAQWGDSLDAAIGVGGKIKALGEVFAAMAGISSDIDAMRQTGGIDPGTVMALFQQLRFAADMAGQMGTPEGYTPGVYTPPDGRTAAGAEGGTSVSVLPQFTVNIFGVGGEQIASYPGRLNEAGQMDIDLLGAMAGA